MTTYIYLFVFVFLLAIFFDGRKVPFWIFFISMIAIGCFVGFSDMLGGYDRYIYCAVFEEQSHRIALGEGVFNPYFEMYFGHEPGFGLWNTFIGLYTPNRYIFIIVTTLVTYLLFINTIYKYCKQPYWAVLLFLGMLFFFSFTYIRQVLAVSIAWLSIPFIIKRKFIPFMAIVALAASFHNSALLFTVAYFIPLKKYPIQKIILVMGVLLILGLAAVTTNFFELYSDAFASAGAKVQDYTTTAQFDSRFEYFAEAVVFLALLFMGYDKIDYKDKKLAVITNIYMMFCGTLLLFIRSSDGGRLAWYSVIGIIGGLSYLLKFKQLNMLKIIVVVLSFSLFHRILTAWTSMIIPYKTCLTPGSRNMGIDRANEYNDDYNTKGKFYNLKNE